MKMNRVIKFRGKRVDNGEWVYGDLHHGFITGNRYINGREIHTETLGQFTGLFDKNGKEIYEGDILNSSLYELCVVEYDDFGTFSPFGHGDYAEISTWLKIIGNIHDNQELLK